MIYSYVEMDLENHLFVITARIIELLNKSKTEMVFDTVLKKFLNKHPEYTPEQFLDALTFLYASGAIELKDFKLELIKCSNS